MHQTCWFLFTPVRGADLLQEADRHFTQHYADDLCDDNNWSSLYGVITGGGRQEIDYTHPAFRFHAERVIRRISARYAEHPAVIGWQVDNEPGLHLFHNHGVFQRFVDELRHTYGDVELLNEARHGLLVEHFGKIDTKIAAKQEEFVPVFNGAQLVLTQRSEHIETMVRCLMLDNDTVWTHWRA